MNRLTIVLLLLAVGLGLLVVNHNGGRTLGIDNDQFAQVLYLLPIAGLLSAALLADGQPLQSGALSHQRLPLEFLRDR